MSPFHQTPEGFSPEMLDLLDRTFTEVWCEIRIRGGAAADEEITRLAIAKSIMEIAAAGVREPERLRRHALHAALDQSPARARPILHLPT